MANDEDLLESSPGKKFQVDIVLLIVILFSAVATKLLRKATEPFSVWVCFGSCRFRWDYLKGTPL